MSKPTPPRDVTDELQQVETMPEAIEILRRWAGSHDKFAKLLGTNRQTVIRWEQGTMPRDYRGPLMSLGVPGRLFLTETDVGELERRVLQIEAEAREIRHLLESFSR